MRVRPQSPIPRRKSLELRACAARPERVLSAYISRISYLSFITMKRTASRRSTLDALSPSDEAANAIVGSLETALERFCNVAKVGGGDVLSDRVFSSVQVP